MLEVAVYAVTRKFSFSKMFKLAVKVIYIYGFPYLMIA